MTDQPPSRKSGHAQSLWKRRLFWSRPKNRARMLDMGCFNHTQYVELTMHFECNLKCQHCMIEGTMDRLQPQSMQQFQSVLDHNLRNRQWKGIIFTGSEVTLRKELPDWARMARRHGFEHVRIQTHGMH